MKGVAIVLLLLNIAYAGWQYSGVGKPPQPVSAEPEEKALLLRAEKQIIDAQQAEEKARIAAEKAKQKAARVAKAKPVPTKPLSNQSGSAVKRVMPQACYTIGPFFIVSDVARVAKQIESNGIITQQRAAAERKRVGLWVYIPPAETLQDAREILRQLQEKDIHDALIISEGAKANAISAGVYRVSGRAEARKAEINVIGYNAVVEPLYRTQPQYWLDLELFRQTWIPKKTWQTLSKEFPGIGQQKSACE